MKKALELPRSVSLISQRERSRLSSEMKRRPRGGGGWWQSKTEAERRRIVAKRSRTRRKASTGRMAVGLRNLLNSCPAQIRQRLWALRDKVGRSPSKREAIMLGEQRLVTACDRVYGGWNTAKKAAGLDVYASKGHVTARRHSGRGREHDLETVLAMLAEWHKAHGSLPTQTQAAMPRKLPLLPCVGNIMFVADTNSWPEAMRRMASYLGIHGGRYGLPEKKGKAA